jgi:hypothetical protein
MLVLDMIKWKAYVFGVAPSVMTFIPAVTKIRQMIQMLSHPDVMTLQAYICCEARKGR